jgi:arginyl-tRNA--protein-N-Asp/Glu arginylyltransferase
MMFRVVWDQLEPCPYRDGQTARLPLRLPARVLTGVELDNALESGDRRSGRMLYRTRCPSCAACEPLRVPVARFRPSPSQRRAVRKNPDITVEVGAPDASAAHVALFNRHKLERGLARTEEPLSSANYSAWLVDTCVDTREFRYYAGGRLVAVSILDIGRTSASSVYHYFDPDEARRSLGVYSVLREIEWCAANGIDWYYLGFYVSDCTHLAYKATYYPHQRRVDGVWVEADADAG